MLKVDGVMGKADSLMLGLNTIAGGNAGGELNLMVKSIRELAEDFDKRSGALMYRRPPHARRHQPRREQFRPQSEPGDVRRQQQRAPAPPRRRRPPDRPPEAARRGRCAERAEAAVAAVAASLPKPSLRAQRKHSVSPRKRLDCFVARDSSQ